MILDDTLLTEKEYIKHASNIAEKHAQNRYGAKSVPHVKKCEEAINATYDRIMSMGKTQDDLHIIPSDEWIADNYYIIKETIDNISIENNKNKLLPIYDIAMEILSHTDGNVGEKEIVSFIQAYEKIKVIDMDLLVNLCQMMQVGLIKRIEQMCRISDKIYNDRNAAEIIYKEYLNYISNDNEENKRSAAILFDNEDTLTPVFAETILRLTAKNGQNDATRAALSGKLASKGTTVEDLISREHKTRISLGVSMGNAIKSLRVLPSLNWDKIMSEISITEQILRKDPADIFNKMTAKSRNEYMRILKVCAKRNNIPPEKYALQILEEAQKENKHIGELIYRDYTKINDFGSFFVMFLFTSFVLAFCPAIYTLRPAKALYGTPGLFLGFFCIILILITVMNVSLSIIQKMYIDKKMPFILPEMDFHGKLPNDCKIMIVLPCLLNSVKRADEIIKQLESAYWANPQEGIIFTLLADLPESPTKTTEQDKEIIEYTKKQIKKHGNRFYFFIRERVYYDKDDKWMGYERKRGAILELNKAIISGDLPHVNYVLTIDADTIIPINTAVKLAQIMHHPLNKPSVEYINAEPVITKGYCILQPTVNNSCLDKEHSTIFENIYGDNAGFDSYSSTISDFYFDICHEGIYTGKGMYDPYVFNAVLDKRFQDNKILSHDLLEGSFVRTGFVSDIHLYDNFPKTYGGYIKREHRWIRGDWQLLTFLGKRIKNQKGVLKNNPLNFYSRFKIFMNLLRSLYPVSLFLMFCIGMLFLKQDAFLWIFIIICALLITAGGTFFAKIKKAICNFAFLPHTFYNHADAILRAIYRTFKSKKNMLEWTVSFETDKANQNTLNCYFKIMWFNFASAALLAPFMFGIPSMIWIAAPFCAYLFSREKISKEQVITQIQIKKFRMTARKIWAFYQDYATENENYLPPDNVQFSPVYAIAHRTSPTNIGFLIISVVLAEEFGFISNGEMLNRLKNIINTLEKMEKWNGHIYNWYDTITLKPLEPIYVSAVDSGNLAACLLSAAALLEQKANLPQEQQKQEYIMKAANALLDTVYCLNEIATEKDKVETWILEEFIKHKKSDNNTENTNDFLRIINHYNLIVNYVKNEKADPHSFRHNLKQMLAETEKHIKNDDLNIQPQIDELIIRIRKLAMDTNFAILYNERNRHICIGYNCSTNTFSDSYYDMLMSEARLTSYVAMAKGDIEAEHFSALARRIDDTGNIFLSWSGTAFEYLLPEIFMPSPYGSALDKSINKMLEIQQKATEGKPWGISESGYNALDINMNYKYKAFGIKELAIKRMYNDETVVAPYASIMASKHIPNEVYQNMELLTKLGAEGKYGYYEAIDFNPGRRGIVESFMAHHVGMAFCGIANLVLNGILERGFGGMAMMKPVSIMLTERFAKSKKAKIKKDMDEKKICFAEEKQSEQPMSVLGQDVQVLSNGRYSVVINGQGIVSSAFCDIGINVQRENEIPEGIIMYLNGTVLKPASCTIYPGSGEYLYLTENMEITQALCVATERNAQVHKIQIYNKSNVEIHKNITVYCKLMLDNKASYASHPSYSSLFVTTKVFEQHNEGLVIKALRRKHKQLDNYTEGFFVLNIPLELQKNIESIMYDTDVLSFIGRNNTFNNPAVFNGIGQNNEIMLSGNQGVVLNPCFAINIKIAIEPGATKNFSYSIGVSDKNENPTEMMDFFSNTERIFELARLRSFVEKEHISLKKGDLQYFKSIAPKIVYGKKYYFDEIKKQIWRFGISGDNPIITVMIKKYESVVHIERLVRMWCFYSFRGIKTDLVLAIFDNADYMSPIHDIADGLAQKAMWGCFAVRGDIFVIAIKDNQDALPLIEASNIIFWF